MVLSQIYPAHEYKTALTGHNYGIVTAGIFFLTIMAVEAFSDNYRVEADILHLQRQYTEAEANYQRSLRYNPYNFRALIGYASVKLHEQALTETKQYLDRALNLYPDSAAAHHLKSKLELVKGHPWQAFFHAFHAYRKNRLNGAYRNWYLSLEGNLKKHLDLVKQKEKP